MVNVDYISCVEEMTMDFSEYNKLFDIEKMRMAVNAFSYCNETFLQRYRIADLMKIRLAWVKSEWDFFPDQWTERQVREALRGKAPMWDDNEQPIYTKPNKLVKGSK